jgi:hypothetical protein
MAIVSNKGTFTIMQYAHEMRIMFSTGSDDGFANNNHTTSNNDVKNDIMLLITGS